MSTAQVHGQAAQVPGVNGAGSRTGGASSGCQRSRFTDRRRPFRVSTVQVPKQRLNLHRESAFYAVLMEQVSALKWNLRRLRLLLNLRHRGASGLFSQLPSRCTYKKTASQCGFDVRTSAPSPEEGTSSDVRTNKQHSSTVSMYVQR